MAPHFIRSTMFACGVAMALLAPVVGGCTGAAEEDIVDSSDDELRALTPEDILGDIAYGQTKTVTVATTKYRALRFQGKAGEQVSAKVSSSASRFAGLWIVDQTFKKSLADVAPQPGALESTASAKLPADGTYYVLLRQTTSKSVTHEVSLTTSSDFGLSQDFETATDPGFVTATFDARAGDRLRISIRPNNTFSGADRGSTKAKISGCLVQDLHLGAFRRESTDVRIATTGRCTISIGSSFPVGGRRSYHVAVVRLDDPERAAYLRGIECEGPEIPLDELGKTMAAASTRMYLRTSGTSGRRRSCNPSTGCSPYEPFNFGESYYLDTSKNGIRLMVSPPDNTLPTGFVNEEGVSLRAKATASCLSIVGDAPDVYLRDRAIRFDLHPAQRPPEEPPFNPECTGTPLSDAAVLRTFAPGSSTRTILFERQGSRHRCNLYSGCEAWGAVEQTSGESMLTVQNGKLTLTGNGRAFAVSDGLILQAGKAIGRVTASCVGYSVEAQSSVEANGLFDAQRWRYTAPAL